MTNSTHTQHGDSMAARTALPTKSIHLACSGYGNNSSSIQDLGEELGQLEAEADDDHLEGSEGGKLRIQAWETGRLRRRQSLVTLTALACRAVK